jgi:DNA ligase-1
MYFGNTSRDRDGGGLVLLNLGTRFHCPRKQRQRSRAPQMRPEDSVYKPMLAVDCGPVEALTFPLIASPKLDGVRAVVGDGTLLSRSLKPIPNARVQTIFYGLPVGLDGELIAGSPCSPNVYRRTMSMVMSEDVPIDGLKLWLFDYQMEGPFTARYERLKVAVSELKRRGAQVELVPQVVVNSLDELLALESEWLAAGYEGAILRRADAPYKHGRSTLKEGFLLKLKRFVDGEARVLSVVEHAHGGVGALRVRDVQTGAEFEIGTGFTVADRETLWAARQNLRRWPLVKYKHSPTGAKDLPRHPVFLGFRSNLDV